MDWTRIDGSSEFIQWFDGAPVCFHDAEIAGIWHCIPTNAGAKAAGLLPSGGFTGMGIASRCVVLVYIYRFSAGGDRKEAVVELDFRNVKSFELTSDFARQMVLDEISLELREGGVRAEFQGIVGIGGYVASDGLSVRLREFAVQDGG